ncbi:MAG TPA: thiol reductant ABC exporter subunit CydD [Acidimicrobiales bacterium]|nr:thiol reductant ABC exporter subunit CydD [Acidimicrobiales bacterium]
MPDIPAKAPQRGGHGRRPVDQKLLAEVPGLKVTLAASVSCGLVAAAAVVVQALALAHLLASAMPKAHPVDRVFWFVLLATGIAGRAGAALVAEPLAGAGASRAKAVLRGRLVMAAVDGSALRRGGPEGPGSTAALAGRGLDALDVYVARCVPDMALAALVPTALLVVVGVLDWPSALIMAVLVALFPIFGALVGRASLSLASERWGQVERLGAQVADLFEGLAILKAFGRADDQRGRIARANDVLRRSTTKVLRVAFLSALVLDTLGAVSVALVAVPLGLRLISGSIALPTALAVLILAPEVFLPLRKASAEFHDSAEGLAAASKALSLVANGASAQLRAPGPPPLAHELAMLAHELPDRSGPALARSSGAAGAFAAELRGVSVWLPGQERALLDNAQLLIPRGQTVLLVGPSGAGKSTVISLLLGFLRPDAGSVVGDGQDLALIDGDGWRSRLTYLPEHPSLLAATIADNLRLAEPRATDGDLVAALGKAGALHWLAGLPAGLETCIGEGSRAVSAGELQRLALARAFLRGRPLYLLDEPTVHLDAGTEAVVLESLREVLTGASALIVSHRTSLARLADRVVSLENGNFVDLPIGSLVGVAT